MNISSFNIPWGLKEFGMVVAFLAPLLLDIVLRMVYCSVYRTVVYSIIYDTWFTECFHKHITFTSPLNVMKQMRLSARLPYIY